MLEDLFFFLQRCDSKELKSLPEMVPDGWHGALQKLPFEGKWVISGTWAVIPQTCSGLPWGVVEEGLHLFASTEEKKKNQNFSAFSSSLLWLAVSGMGKSY